MFIIEEIFDLLKEVIGIVYDYVEFVILCMILRIGVGVLKRCNNPQ